MRKSAIERGGGGRFLLSLVEIDGRTCLACRLGQLAAERHWRSLAPRHALRRAQPCLVAKTFGTLTKNGEVSTRLTSPFLAGAEGLEPSARGFGVDVGESTRERGRGGVGRFLLQVTKRAVLGWCCEEISGPKGRENPGKAGNTLTRIDKDRIIKVPGLLPAGRLLQTGG